MRTPDWNEQFLAAGALAPKSFGVVINQSYVITPDCLSSDGKGCRSDKSKRYDGPQGHGHKGAVADTIAEIISFAICEWLKLTK